ncbi:hypothetical protein C0989_004676, partial [Termitomyces sp. Mn162]
QHVQQQAQQYAAAAAAAAAALPPPDNEFRARFHRPLVPPTPFRSFNPGSTPSSSAGATAPTETPATTTTTATAAIDPHLNTNGTTKSASPTSNDGDFATDDPDFG